MYATNTVWCWGYQIFFSSPKVLPHRSPASSLPTCGWALSWIWSAAEGMLWLSRLHHNILVASVPGSLGMLPLGTLSWSSCLLGEACVAQVTHIVQLENMQSLPAVNSQPTENINCQPSELATPDSQPCWTSVWLQLQLLSDYSCMKDSKQEVASWAQSTHRTRRHSE